jgi:Pigment-dispersing hormone (PDH)
MESAKSNKWIILQYDSEVNAGWIPVPANYFSPPNYMPASYYQTNHLYPTHNDKMKNWLVAPSKRNSELINSLLGLPKNMDAAGK